MTLSEIKDNRTKAPEGLERFYMGRVYPALLCLFTLVGYVTETELYFNVVSTLMLSLGLLVCSSIRPLVPYLLVLLFQVPPAHSPAKSIRLENGSDYYFRPENIIPTAIVFAVALLSLLVFFLRNNRSARVKLAHVPFFVPSVLLSVAFLTNGLLLFNYKTENIVLAFAEILAFVLLFYFFYYGLKIEKGKDFFRYFIYVNSLVALLLVLETIWIYYSGDVVVVSAVTDEFQIVKTQIYYGWGVATTAGQAITVTLPLLLYGAMRSKGWVWYLSIAFLTYCSVIFTLSRCAILVSTIAVIVSVIIGCFHGRNKNKFRVLLPLGIAAGLIAGVLFFGSIERIFTDLFDAGFSDNGRYNLWRKGINAFLRHPIFGEGFWNVHNQHSWLHINLFPQMVHNTVFQILGSMGLFGMVAYTVYRIATVRVFLRYPRLGKTMLGVAILTILGQSLLDNFIFYVQPMFYYAIALAVAVKLTDESELHAHGSFLASVERHERSTVELPDTVKLRGTELAVSRPDLAARSPRVHVYGTRITRTDLDKSRKKPE